MYSSNFGSFFGWGLPFNPLDLVGVMDNITGIVMAIGVAVVAISVINLIIIVEFKKDLTSKLDRVVALYRDERNLMSEDIRLLREKLIVASEAIVRLDTLVNKEKVI